MMVASMSQSHTLCDTRVHPLPRAWGALRRAQDQYHVFRARIDEITHIYSTWVLPQERAMLLAPSHDLVAHLICFIEDQSLSEKQRDSLLHWVERLIGNIARLDEPLALELSNSKDYAMDLWADQQAGIDTFARELKEQLRQQFEPKSHYTDTLEEPKVSIENESLGEAQKLLSTLFRKTAQVIHPDREHDPLQKKHKAALMHRLIKARQNQDIMTILDIYSEHVPHAQIDEIDPDYLLATIQAKTKAIELEHDQYLLNSPLRLYAYDLVGSQLHQEAQIANAISHFAELRGALQHCRTEITSVERLCSFLVD